MTANQRDGLTVQEVHDELLVFHPDRNEASALNRSAALVFHLCDGEHDVDSMRQALDVAGLGPASDDTVWLALDELADADLIVLNVTPPDHLGRRELLKKLGAGAAAAAVILPVVETIGAPPASAQGSSPTTTVAPTTAPTPSTTAAPTAVPSTTAAPTAVPSTTAAPTVTPTPVNGTVTPTPAPGTVAPTASPTVTPTVGS